MYCPYLECTIKGGLNPCQQKTFNLFFDLQIVWYIQYQNKPKKNMNKNKKTE